MTAVDHAELKRVAEGLLRGYPKSRVIYERDAQNILALLTEIERSAG